MTELMQLRDIRPVFEDPLGLSCMLQNHIAQICKPVMHFLALVGLEYTYWFSNKHTILLFLQAIVKTVDFDTSS